MGVQGHACIICIVHDNASKATTLATGLHLIYGKSMAEKKQVVGLIINLAEKYDQLLNHPLGVEQPFDHNHEDQLSAAESYGASP